MEDKEFIEKVKDEFKRVRKNIDDLTSRVEALEKELSELKEKTKKDEGWF